jgi:hypothetical protein
LSGLAQAELAQEMRWVCEFLSVFAKDLAQLCKVAILTLTEAAAFSLLMVLVE